MSGHTEVIPAALGISYKTTLDKEGRREIVMQGHLPIDAPLTTINEVLDRIAKAVDRQAAVYELEQANVQRDQMVDRLHEMEAQVANTHELSKARWDAENRKGEWSEEKLSAPERNALSGISSSRIKYREGIEQAQATIDRLERVIAAAVES